MSSSVLKYILLAAIGMTIIFLYNSNTEPYGIWSSIKDVEASTSLTTNLFGKTCEECKATIENGVGSNIKERVITGGKFIANISVKSVNNENDAIQRAKEIISENEDALGVQLEMWPPIQKVEAHVVGSYSVFFEPQEFNGLKICNSRGSGAITVAADGRLETIGLAIYPNLTAPTKQKISDEKITEELKRIYEEKARNNPEYKWIAEKNINITVEPYQNTVCIFPKWHPDGEYWTYHLSKTYGIQRPIGDAIFYDIVGNAGILGRIEPIIE